MNTATYSCNIGHTLINGDEIRECQSDRTWSGVQPTCQGRSNINYNVVMLQHAHTDEVANQFLHTVKVYCFILWPKEPLGSMDTFVQLHTLHGTVSQDLGYGHD